MKKMLKKKFYIVFSGLLLVAVLIVGFTLPSLEEESKPSLIVENLMQTIYDVDDLTNGTMWACYQDYVVPPSLNSEMAGDEGNLYAPDIIVENNVYKMWYGAQSDEGHDSIHFATSDDGRTWLKYGIVIPKGKNNHVNDPSVVKVNG